MNPGLGPGAGQVTGAAGVGQIDIGGTPNGMLEKLTILAHTQPDYGDPAIARFAAYVNPAEITQSYEVEYDAAQGSGTTGSRMEFKKIKPGDLTLTFFIDGTGANGFKAEVQAAVGCVPAAMKAKPNSEEIAPTFRRNARNSRALSKKSVEGLVATSSCDCSISRVTAEPSPVLSAARNADGIRRCTALVSASTIKYSSSMPKL